MPTKARAKAKPLIYFITPIINLLLNANIHIKIPFVLASIMVGTGRVLLTYLPINGIIQSYYEEKS